VFSHCLVKFPPAFAEVVTAFQACGFGQPSDLVRHHGSICEALTPFARERRCRFLRLSGGNQ